MSSANSPARDASRSRRLRSRSARLAAGLSLFYAALLGALLVMRYGLGDRTWWSFAANALLLYAFLPVPFVLLAAVLYRLREAYATFGVVALLFAWHWGALVVPRGGSSPTGGTTLRVMTYNLLGFNADPAATVRVLRDVDADIVALQELSPEHADAISKALSVSYPYSLMDARPGVTGSGILSRYPFTRVSTSPLDRTQWIGDPMAVELNIGQECVTFVNFHAFAGPQSVMSREAQAEALSEYPKEHPGCPLIVVGDLNATDQNAAYAIITRTMRDAFREAGWGFGHTFPGEPTAERGGSRPALFGVPVPMWLIRIDYIFHSDTLAAIDASIGPGDGGSDHRPVTATFVFRHE